METSLHLQPIILGGHWGSGISVFRSGFNYNLQYGRVKRGSRMVQRSIPEPDFQISDIGKEDMIKLATLLLAIVAEG